MTDPAGSWALTVATPIGKVPVTVRLSDEAGTLRGTAESRGETVPLTDLTATPEPGGLRLTWRQSVTKPMRLNLRFDVLATADTLDGHSQAGRLPRSTVTGVRIEIERP
jgi:hypothetical protein